MVVSNWDDHIGNYLYYNQICKTPIPDLECNGELSWGNVLPGSTVTGSLIVENVGDDFSELDWEVTEFPTWGEWTFTPDSGSGLTPEDEPVTINVSVIAPPDENKAFAGYVIVVNKENTSDYSRINVYLKTPRSKSAYHPLFSRIINRFPNAFPILRYIINIRYAY